MAKGSCVQWKHTVDCINVPMEPTLVEELNIKAVVDVRQAFRCLHLEATVNQW